MSCRYTWWCSSQLTDHIEQFSLHTFSPGFPLSEINEIMETHLIWWAAGPFICVSIISLLHNVLLNTSRVHQGLPFFSFFSSSLYLSAPKYQVWDVVYVNPTGNSQQWNKGGANECVIPLVKGVWWSLAKAGITPPTLNQIMSCRAHTFS